MTKRHDGGHRSPAMGALDTGRRWAWGSDMGVTHRFTPGRPSPAFEEERTSCEHD